MLGLLFILTAPSGKCNFIRTARWSDLYCAFSVTTPRTNFLIAAPTCHLSIREVPTEPSAAGWRCVWC
ncbi:hypothetical protein PF005_g9615 [Phytophthora fragariae]|uniref:Secreted protein n=1 Tax=Phytophthora fragariae TaxID=53985 RepID=A0A6A3ILE5_9STRA|nr:hypothetical protein PF003_g6492 [Phytophthora fragariae]KAE8922928.1 hypothetical protein PF009_g26812 [Phytophthora fragariae]KAE8983766.1 hypothetical protein PF011_g21049 [Phytophthora fragariae]KAE9072647.1 hypothetical protein PF007_g26101 [Phytophthora fragariae]KAE9088989.1 hypothetical protein PF006_g25457 [Phytophthora fragariae]